MSLMSKLPCPSLPVFMFSCQKFPNLFPLSAVLCAKPAFPIPSIPLIPSKFPNLFCTQRHPCYS